MSNPWWLPVLRELERRPGIAREGFITDNNRGCLLGMGLIDGDNYLTDVGRELLRRWDAGERDTQEATP